MEKTEIVIDSKLQSNLNLLIGNTLPQEEKIEEDLDFFLNDKASQPKKSIQQNKTVQFDQNKVQKLFDEHSYIRVKEEDLFD